MLQEIRNIIRKELEDIFNEDFRFNNDQKTFSPPPEVVAAAKKAHDFVQGNDLTSSGGNEGSGKQKAVSLINKEPITFSAMKRMKAFFDGNKEEVQAEKASGKTLQNSGTIQSWELWGGDSCQRWVEQELESNNAENLRRKGLHRNVGGAGVNKGMGSMGWKSMMDTTNTRTHR